MKTTSTYTSTYFALLSEFGTSEIPLDKCCLKYFGLDVLEAKRRAGLQKLPIPAYRPGSQKSGWLISAHDLSVRIDELQKEARLQWLKTHEAA